MDHKPPTNPTNERQHSYQNWQQWEKRGDWGARRGYAQGRRMFFRFLVSFGVIVLVVAVVMGIMAWFLTQLAGGGGHITFYVWMAGLAAMIILPMIAIRAGFRAFRKVAIPLSELVSAANKVGQGDLSVRVGEHGGDFTPISKAFNRMVSELQLADERRRNLTADVAHELRTPLHIIQGNLEGVLDGVYDPSPDHIEATLDETHMLARLIEDLRILSLAESGQLPLNLEQIDPHELLTDVQTGFSGQAAEAGIELSVQGENGVTIDADYGRLTQVINNLVSNALRYTPNGGQIELASIPNGESVEIKVSDSGAGISEDHLPFIFDRFWRGDKSRPHSGSTGLGLAISQQLVLAMNGDISVESEIGKGTSFLVSLPKKHA